ncbi:hypothetical protein ABT224_33980 [Streptomyces sp. NPDC001584]|uniref:hypothetical protein n=1 Tax=Streptomyces sp. NPDC001584 TaxID=3154521 RepID=UPI00332EF035
MRGLTHRAVYRRAAMPPGTTSAYYRTRAALLTALVTRLVHLDQAVTCIDGLVFDRPVNGGDVPREALEGLAAAALRPAGRAGQPVGTPASR